MGYKITVEGIPEVVGKFHSVHSASTIYWKRRIDVASTALRERIIQDLVEGTWGIKSRSGTAGLAGTVHEIPAEETEGGMRGGVVGAGSPHDYGAYFEKGGSGPYTIVGKPVLAWKAYGAFQANTKQRKFAFTADMIFAKRVNHPAIKKAPWMTGPFKEMQAEIMKILGIENAQEELFGG